MDVRNGQGMTVEDIATRNSGVVGVIEFQTPNFVIPGQRIAEPGNQLFWLDSGYNYLQLICRDAPILCEYMDVDNGPEISLSILLEKRRISLVLNKTITYAINTLNIGNFRVNLLKSTAFVFRQVPGDFAKSLVGTGICELL